MRDRKNYWETPMMAYWRRLNAELERLGAKPVLLGDAFVAYGSSRDPQRAAADLAQSQGVDVSAFILPPAA
jgi:hypothetical protein